MLISYWGSTRWEIVAVSNRLPINKLLVKHQDPSWSSDDICKEIVLGNIKQQKPNLKNVVGFITEGLKTQTVQTSSMSEPNVVVSTTDNNNNNNVSVCRWADIWWLCTSLKVTAGLFLPFTLVRQSALGRILCDPDFFYRGFTEVPVAFGNS